MMTRYPQWLMIGVIIVVGATIGVSCISVKSAQQKQEERKLLSSNEEQVQQLWTYVNHTIQKMGRPERLFRAEPGRTALLVVDMQDAFCSTSGCLENPDTHNIVKNINVLVGTCRKVGIPVIWVRLVVNRDQSNAGLWSLFQPVSPYGPERGKPPIELSEVGKETGLWKELDVDLEKDYQVLKCRYSAFIPGSSNLERLLRTIGCDTLIITGVGTNVCCESTARDAMMLDFRVIFVSDANATFHPVFHEMTLMNIRLLFGDVVKTAELLRELTGGKESR